MAADDSLNHDFGIVKLKITETYASFWSDLTDEEFNVIGIYRKDSTGSILNLYRIFDNTSVNYFGNNISLERLSRHFIVRKLLYYSFNLESWNVDKNTSLYNRFKVTVAVNIMETPSEKNYEELICQTFMVNGSPLNGYNRINNILIRNCDIESNSYISKDLIGCKYLNIPIEFECHDDSINHSPSYADVNKVSIEMFNTLWTSIGNFSRNEEFLSNFSKIISSKFDKSFNPEKKEFSEKEKIKLFHKFKKDVDDLGKFLHQTFSFEDDGSTQVLKVSELIYRYNMLAIETGSYIISPEDINDGKMGSKIISVTEKVENIDIALKTGREIKITTLVESSHGEGLKNSILYDLHYEELREILIYVLALKKTQKTLNLKGLIDRIVTELAKRSKI